jgi:hypothetical protein
VAEGFIMANYKVCTKYVGTDGKTYFNVDGKVASQHEKALLTEIKEVCGWPMYMYEGHIEDAYGMVVQI